LNSGGEEGKKKEKEGEIAVLSAYQAVILTVRLPGEKKKREGGRKQPEPVKRTAWYKKGKEKGEGKREK